MPALPRAIATEPHVLDARQLHTSADNAAKAMAAPVRNVLKRLTDLLPRQSSTGPVYIPVEYKFGGPSPGLVAGIVLGSIAGFLILLWVLWAVSTSGSGFIRSTNLVEEDVVVRRRSRSRGTRKSRRTEMRSRSPRRERVVRQERIVRSSVPPPREASRFRETILVDEMRGPPPPPMGRRVEGDDIVEVFEEHSSIDVPPPRRKSRR